MNRIYLLCVCCYLSVSAWAQAGSRCSNALLMTPATYTIDTMYAGGTLYNTLEPFPDRGRWFKFTPTNDGLATISSCNGGADTRVFVYTGKCDSLVIFGYNDDACSYHRDSIGDYASSFSKPVKAGVTYYVMWDNAWSDDDFSFTYTLTPYAPTAMQDCSMAQTIKVGTTQVESLQGYASHGNANRANWYKITPTQTSTITISSCGTEPDTRVWVYDNICTALRTVIDADDNCLSFFNDTLSATVTFRAVANKTYYIEWDDYGEDLPFDFSVSQEVLSATTDPALMKAVRVSPNPAKDLLTFDVDLTKTSDLSVNLVNTVGQTVLTQKWSQILRGSQTVDISDLKAGMYIVQIRESNRIAYQKLIISR